MTMYRSGSVIVSYVIKTLLIVLYAVGTLPVLQEKTGSTYKILGDKPLGSNHTEDREGN